MANNIEDSKTETRPPAAKSSGGIYKSVALVFIISAICRVFGFLREVTIAYKFGTSAEVDAYNMAISIFNIFALVFGTMLTTAYTPLYTQTLNEQGRKGADRVTSNILNILLISAVSLTVLCEIFAPQIAGLIAKGFTDPQKMQMTIDMSRILFPGLALFGLYYFFISVLNAQKKFLIVEFATIFIGLGVIVSAVTLSGIFGAYSLAIGTTLAYLLQFLVLIPSLSKCYRYTPVLTLRDTQTQKFFRLMAPSLIGVAAAEINSIIDRALASGLPDGSVSALSYAQRINSFATTILMMPIITVMFTKFSECTADKRKDDMSTAVRHGIEALTVVCLPVTVLMLAACEDLIRIVYNYGAFGEVGVELTTLSLFYYTLGLLFLAYKTILNRAFYAQKNTKTPMITGLIFIGLNIVFNILLIKPMGVGGLALANSISVTVAAILMYIIYIKMYGSLNLRKSGKDFGMMFLGTGACLLVYFVLNMILKDANLYLRFILSCGCGAGAYVAVLRMARVGQFMELWNMVFAKLKRKK